MARQAQAPGLALELGLGGPGPGHDEAHVAQAADERRQRVEGEMKALLVDEAAHEQDEALVGARRTGRAGRARSTSAGSQLARIDAVGDRGQLARAHAEHACARGRA